MVLIIAYSHTPILPLNHPRPSGLIHWNEKMALASLVSQLQLDTRLNNELSCSNLSFADCLSFVLNSLQGNVHSIPIVLILDEFEYFGRALL